MRSGVFAGLALLALLGCSVSHAAGDGGSDGGAAHAVGAECLPASVPAGGYDSREIHLEYAAPQCGVPGGTGSCLVYQ